MPTRVLQAVLFLSLSGLSQVVLAGIEAGTGFDVISYDIKIRPDFSNKTLAGETKIKLRSTKNGLKAIVFSDNALFLDKVRVGGRPAVITRKDEKLTIELPKPLSLGSIVNIQATYHGTPKRGVIFNSQSVYTGYFACDWMICAQNTVGDKASMRLALTLPKGWISIGPGVLMEKKNLPTGEEIHIWQPKKNYSAYLFAFAAGKYQTYKEQFGSVELAYVSEVATLEELRSLFAPTSAMLRFFQDKAGVKFPQKQYIQLLVNGGVAQEAVTHSIIGRKMIDPILSTPEEDWVIAHELAHQWWGNLVTCKSLKHFWLNEGVTSFMVAAWKEHKWGRAAYLREMRLFSERVSQAKEAGIDVPLTYSGLYPSLGIRRAIQYSKGALFMDKLRSELGEKAFWAGLKLFTRKHAYGTVVSKDAQTAFEQTSGRKLDAIFDEWVF